MIDFFLNLVKVNESVDYAAIISIIVSYFLIIWLVITVWIFNDARKRYVRFITAFLFTLFVLFFGPPALIFYIMIRPEHTLEEDYLINLALSGEKELRPIYFDGDRGFDISINLSVQPKQSPNDKHKMNMSIDWMPTKADLQKTPVPAKVVRQTEPGGIAVFFNNLGDSIKQGFNSVTSQVQSSKNKIASAMQESKEKKNDSKEESPEESVGEKKDGQTEKVDQEKKDYEDREGHKSEKRKKKKRKKRKKKRK